MIDIQTLGIDVYAPRVGVLPPACDNLAFLRVEHHGPGTLGVHDLVSGVLAVSTRIDPVRADLPISLTMIIALRAVSSEPQQLWRQFCPIRHP